MSACTTILGHRAQCTALSDDRAQGNVSNAYLFSGPRHVGKFTVARWFTRELLCDGKSEPECGEIHEQIDRLLHPDLLVIDQLWMEDACEDARIIAQSSNISQEHRMKAKAKTDTISIDDIRALQMRLHDVAAGRYRCCLIRSAERMQPEAVNALLKILEEPPPGVTFLLTTQSLSSLLPTLTSRARTVHFQRLRNDDIAPLLTGVPDDEQRFLLRVAQGAPGIVQRLRAYPEELRKAKQAHSSALAFWHSRSSTDRLQFLGPLQQRTADADQLLLHLALACREEAEAVPAHAAACLTTLVRGLETNVNRQLLVQQFVLALVP